jgi:putative ABC transport system permease protein
VNVLEAFRTALTGLASNRLRSFLTMLGIIIGVAAVISTTAIGQGASRATQEQIARLGTNVLTVTAGAQRSGALNLGAGSGMSLTLEDSQAIARRSRSVARVAPEYTGRARVQFKGENTSTSVLGTTPEYVAVRSFELADGRFFTAREVEQRRRVVVLGSTVRQEVFGDRDPTGKSLKISGQSFRVVGVLRPKGDTGFRSPDNQVYIPISTAMRRLFAVDHLTGVSVQAVSQEQMARAQREIERVIRRQHRIAEGDPLDVRITNQADVTEAAAQTNRTITLLLGVIGGIALFVGGIGIMNIMLVSVTERTREIGLRMAIGARRADILSQFLIEAVTMSLVGGAIGVAAGLGAPLLISRWTGWPMLVSPGAVLLSFGFAAAVGVFFGLFPAVKAARLAPIQALRYE